MLILQISSEDTFCAYFIITGSISHSQLLMTTSLWHMTWRWKKLHVDNRWVFFELYNIWACCRHVNNICTTFLFKNLTKSNKRRKWRAGQPKGTKRFRSCDCVAVALVWTVKSTHSQSNYSKISVELTSHSLHMQTHL